MEEYSDFLPIIDIKYNSLIRVIGCSEQAKRIRELSILYTHKLKYEDRLGIIKSINENLETILRRIKEYNSKGLSRSLEELPRHNLRILFGGCLISLNYLNDLYKEIITKVANYNSSDNSSS
ncbi:MAG: hypothetical protein QXJ28_00930 [Candidatus Pacearchaeota archaeon]